jgi:hypothetical protein
MRNKILKFYSYLSYKNELIEPTNRGIFHKLAFTGGSKVLNFVFNTSLRTVSVPVSNLPNNDIVVSLTSFPARINGVWKVIHSIFNQTVLPGKIVLYLYINEFPNKLEDIPQSLKKFLSHGLEICFVQENLKSHIKYFYAMQEFRNKTLITLDDDIYYYRDTIERLIRISETFPGVISANLVREIFIDSEGNAVSYSKWGRYTKSDYSSHSLLALGYGGVLYPNTIKFENLLNKDDILENCLSADDLWLKVNEMIENIRVATGEFYPEPMYLTTAANSALSSNNVQGEKRNDSVWIQLIHKYKLENYFVFETNLVEQRRSTDKFLQ